MDRALKLTELAKLELGNARLLARTRIALVLAAFLTIFLEPPGSGRVLLWAILLLYGAYGVAEMLRLGDGRLDRFSRISHWVDAASYSIVIALSGALTSPFALFLLFPVVVVSFQRGFRRGAEVAFVCAVIFAGIAAAPTWLTPDSTHEPLQIGWLLLFSGVALMIAGWGQAEVLLMRRLAFSNDLNQLFSPRNSLSDAIHALAKMIRDYQNADACIVVMNDPKSAGGILYLADGNAPKAPQGEHIDSELAQPLRAIPADCAVLFNWRGFPWQRASGKAYDCDTLRPRPVDRAALIELDNLLEAKSYMSVPIGSRSQSIGRLHVASQRRHFTQADVRFLAQVVRQAGLMIENMRLVDRLALEVATEERRRISRDLHDGTIQPYMGLKLGLEALRRRLNGTDGVSHEIDELIRMAGDSIDELRHYVGGLKNSRSNKQQDFLFPVVRNQAKKFSEFCGIDTRVLGNDDIAVSGRLYDEVVHIVREGLSNIRRHTSAQHATISLRADDGQLLLELVNDNAPGLNGATAFFPRSIGERARDLGGRVSVERRDGGCTAVLVRLPL